MPIFILVLKMSFTYGVLPARGGLCSNGVICGYVECVITISTYRRLRHSEEIRRKM